MHLDIELANTLLKRHLLPFISEKNSSTFVMNVLVYMGLMKGEKTTIVSNDITSSLISLTYILSTNTVSLVAAQELYAFIQLDDPRFRFCQMERETLLSTLEMAIDITQLYTVHPICEHVQEYLSLFSRGMSRCSVNHA